MIFWVQTIIPLLDDLADAFNHSFRDELGPNETIEYDISNVPAMREALYSKVETAKMMHNMGVPFDALNSLFGFGVDEFDGWDVSHVSNGAVKEAEARDVKKKTSLRLLKKEMLRRTGT